MVLYIFVAVITVLLGLVVNNQYMKQPNIVSRQQILNKLCLVSVFLLLFAVSACRLNVGNDYAKYVEFMHLINCDAYVPTEFGFNWIVKLLYYLSGFENYLLVFAVFAFFTILFFLVAIYKQADSFAFSFFLFMAFGYYFQSFNTVRYYLALAIGVLAIPYVLRKEWVKFVLLVLLGATLHKSLLVVIPLYILASLTWKKWQLALAALFCTTFFFLQDFYLKVVVFLYPTYEDTEYLTGGTSLVNIVRCLGVLVLSLMYYKKAVKDNRRNSFYFYCNLGALVMYVCCSFLPIISRIGYYLTITHIFFIPALLKSVENAKLRKLFTVGVVAAGILYFGVFILMKAGADGLRILPYETFMFHDMVPILSDVN
ncbi:MAG: EpsG family protein [Lachnospiraceae bacterium]|nr:EpsG family protein [Lachnospiraceae bacterium]